MSDFRRRIEAEAKAARDRLHAKTVPPVRGTVEAVETVQRSATVWVGTKKVTASYEGRVPEVGEEVVLAKDGSTWLVISITDKPVAFGGPGSPLTPPLGGTNTMYISECWLWGHSYVGSNLGMLSTYGWDDEVGHPFALDDYLFGALGIEWPGTRTLGQFGSQLYGMVGAGAMNYGKVGGPAAVGLVHPYNQGVGPYMARRGCHALIFGTNDVALQGDPGMEGGRAITQWKHSVQSMTAWLRLGAYFPAYQLYNAGAPEGGTEVASKYAGVTYGSGWARTPPAGAVKTQGNGGLSLFNQTFYPADGYMQTTTSSSTATVRVPADHPGTTVWLFFIGEIGATGAPAVAITWTGGSATLSTNDIVRTPQVGSNALTGTNVPSTAICSVAVPLLRTGVAQTITINAGTVAGGHKLRFCGWGIEAVDPKLVAWGTIPIPKIWHGDTVGGPAGMHWPAWPDPSGHASQGGAQPSDRVSAVEAADSWAATYDAATAEVAARFLPAGSVCVASLATFNGISAKYLFRDNIHPNREGNRVLADALVAGMNLLALTPTNLASVSAGRDLASLILAAPA